MNLRDLKFEPKFSPENVEKAKQWLVSNKSRFKFTANFAVFSSSGKMSEFVNQACHYNIQYPNIMNRELVATECAWDRLTNGSSRDWARPVLNWLLKESYFGRFILNRDDPEFCLEYGFIVSADVWTPLFQNIMIMTRAFMENGTGSFRKFGELVTQGVPGDLAFALTFTTNYNNLTLDTHPVDWRGSGHRTTQTFRKDSLLNFLHGETCKDEKILNDPKNHYRHYKSYGGGSKIFWDSDPSYLGPSTFIDDFLTDKTCDFRATLSAYRKQTTQQAMYKAPNPFAKRDPNAVPVGHNQISYKELWEVFVPWFLKTYYNEDMTLKERKSS